MQAIDDAPRLTAAREARGLSIEEVARELRLAPRQIAALERGDWAALPGLAFVRGALRGYGRFLSLDVEPLVARVAENINPAELRSASTLGKPLPRHGMLGFDEGGSGNRYAWAALVLVTLIAVALYFGGTAPMSSIRSWIGAEPGAAASVPSVRPPAGREPAATEPAAAEAAPATDAGRTVVTPVQILPPPTEPAGKGQR